MKKRVVGLLAVVGICMSGSMVSFSEAKGYLEDLGITASGTLDYASKYMWRGYTIDQDPVVQPGFSLAAKGFTVSYWSNMAIANRDASTLSNEVDMTVSYTLPLGPVALTLGHVSYNYTGILSDTKEVFAGLALNNLPVAVAVSAYSDYDAIVGNYVSLDLSKDLPVTSDITATIAGHYGQYFSYGTIDNGSDYALSMKCGVPLTSVVSLTPSITYAAPAGDLADEAIGNQKSGLWGGFSLGYSF
jgi:uncharacterized protein (TIGR02001 family)